jgi:hypothetical protein
MRQPPCPHSHGKRQWCASLMETTGAGCIEKFLAAALCVQLRNPHTDLWRAPMPSRQSRPLSHCTANQRISCVSVRIRIFACAVHAPGHDEWGVTSLRPCSASSKSRLHRLLPMHRGRRGCGWHCVMGLVRSKRGSGADHSPLWQQTPFRAQTRAGRHCGPSSGSEHSKQLFPSY